MSQHPRKSFHIYLTDIHLLNDLTIYLKQCRSGLARPIILGDGPAAKTLKNLSQVACQLDMDADSPPSYNVTSQDLFDLFGKFGPVRQIRQGTANNTKGTAFVVYDDVTDAKQACDKLNGFNFQNRYLVVLFHQPEKMAKSKEDLEERQKDLERLKEQHGIE